ncbi:ABC transporter, ATP-binding protein [Clostridiales bacterium KA00134]|nr:ABC transporter, ATP-binding protein [Clostridiales bacterium KA00134]
MFMEVVNLIELENIRVSFKQKDKLIKAVDGVNLKIEDKDIFGIVGFSGAGKSTLVRCINLLQRPDEGRVLVNGKDLLSMSAKDLRSKRRKIGMIFQHFNLMKSRTILDNVIYPLKHSKLSKKEKIEKAKDLLSLVGIVDKQGAYPGELSGGQKQRVAIARALANDPDILLCDEATSALDPQTTLQILNLLKDLNKKLGITIVIITHEMQVVKEICNKLAVMENGKVIEVGTAIEIFSKPKQKLTQEFIKTANNLDSVLESLRANKELISLKDDERILELSYLGTSTTKPLIVEIYERFKVKTSILWGNIEFISNIPLGSLIVKIKGDEENLKSAFHFLEKEGVRLSNINLSEVFI